MILTFYLQAGPLKNYSAYLIGRDIVGALSN